MRYDRIVVGGGLFGCLSALELSRGGHSVALIDSNRLLMSRASYVNQARLHTGLHYPRSIMTGLLSLRDYHGFRARFAPAILDFNQIYAISSHGSKTDPAAFEMHAGRLGLEIERVEGGELFRIGTVAAAYRVEEPTFDPLILRDLVTAELDEAGSIDVQLGTSVVGLDASPDRVVATLDDRTTLEADGVVLATYAGLNAMREMLGLPLLPLAFELTEVLLSSPPTDLARMGITLMDGQFWSFMPFGKTGLVSITNVGMTPIARSVDRPKFTCQSRRDGCTPDLVADCNSCAVRPRTRWQHQIQQMTVHFPRASEFSFHGSLLTTKTILRTTEVDDARPSVFSREDELPVWTVLSGKVSAVMSLEGALS